MITRSFRCHEKAMILLCVFNFATKANASAPAVYRERRQSRPRAESQVEHHHDPVRACGRRPPVPGSPTQKELVPDAGGMDLDLEAMECESSASRTPEDPDKKFWKPRPRATFTDYHDLENSESDNEEEELSPSSQDSQRLRRNPGLRRLVLPDPSDLRRRSVSPDPADLRRNPGLLRSVSPDPEHAHCQSDNEEEELSPSPQDPERLRKNPGAGRSVCDEEKTNLCSTVRRKPEDKQQLPKDLLGDVSLFLPKEEIQKHPGLMRAKRARAGTVWGSQWPNEKKLDYILRNEKKKNFLLRDPSHYDDSLYMIWYSADHEITQKGILVDTWVDWYCTRRCHYTRRRDNGTAKIQFYRYHDDGPMPNYWEKIDPQGPNLIDYWNYAEKSSFKMDREKIDDEKRSYFKRFYAGRMNDRVEL